MRIFFIIITLLYSINLHSKVINLQYEIDWKSVHLADLFWNITINDSDYEIEFLIKSFGLTDKIYKYKSITTVKGHIDGNYLRPFTYRSKTKSSNQDVYANIDYSFDGLIKKIDVKKSLNDEQLLMQDNLINQFQYFTDPISQLSQYLLYKSNSDRIIIDGLNIYELISNDLIPINFDDKNSIIYQGNVDILELSFPFFRGLHKLDKKNNLKEIKMYYANIDKYNIPIQFDILSTKFKAKLYLKKYEIN